MGRFRPMAKARATALAAEAAAIFLARTLAAEPVLGLDSVKSGEVAGVTVGTITVAGFTAAEISSYSLSNNAGNQFALLAPNIVQTGATPTNYAVDPSVTVEFGVTFTNGVTITRSAEITITGAAASGATITIPTLKKKLLASHADVLTFLNATPSGNVVNISKTAGQIELTTGAIYATGDAVVPAPSASYSGPANTGWASWTEDGNARTMAPDYSAAEGNGTGALGKNVSTDRAGHVAGIVAAPNLRMLTPWWQRFTGKLTLAFEAHFEDPTTGVDAIEKVRVYVEGVYIDLTTRTSWRYTDVNGVEQWVDGVYVCEIDAANYTAFSTDALRDIYVYARAYTTVAGVSTQLIGRSTKEGVTGTTLPRDHRFFPATTAHDVLIQVTPSATAASRPAGAYPSAFAIFKTLEDAISYTAISGASAIQGITAFGSAAPLAPKIEITESGDYHPVNRQVGQYGRGYVTITAATGVTATIGRASWDSSLTLSTVYSYDWRPARSGLEFRGSGIVFDMTYLSNFTLGSSPYPTWFNGCRSACDYNIVELLSDQGMARTGLYLMGENAGGFLTDCPDVSYLGSESYWISRNNTRPIGPCNSDLYNRVWVGVGDVIRRLILNAMRTYRPAIEFTAMPTGGSVVKVGYEGDVGSNLTRLQEFHLKVDGVTVHMLDLKNASYTSTGFLRMSDVVTWVNSKAGWACTSLVTPNDRITDRNAVYMTNYDAPLTMAGTRIARTRVDQHLDFRQSNGSASIAVQNSIVRAIRVFDADWMQSNFFDGSSGMPTINVLMSNIFISQNPYTNNAAWKDWDKVNVRVRAFADVNSGSTFYNTTGTTGNYWRADGYGLCDEYTQYFGNVFWYHGWNHTPKATARPVIRKSHFTAGYTNYNLQVAESVSTGGAEASLYPGIANMDIRPGGLLLTNTITSGDYSDAQGIIRDPASTHKGPSTFGLANGAITKAQALNLQAVSCAHVVGTGVATISLSRKAGAGETGNTETLVVTVNTYDIAA